MKWSKNPANGHLAVVAPSGRVLAEVWPHVSLIDGSPLGLHRACVPGRSEYPVTEADAIAWAESELSRLAADLAGAGVS